jgi:chromosome partitioning protein
MSIILTIAGHQGGSGKTTTAINLGHGLAGNGRRVLLVDGDPQGTLTVMASAEGRDRPGLLDAIQATVEPVMIITPTVQEHLAVVACGVRTVDQVGILDRFASAGNFPALLQTLSVGFDYVIVDAPAGLGPLVGGYMAASDGVILTLGCEEAGLETLPLMLELVASVRQTVNPTLKMGGILLTRHRDDAVGTELIQKIEDTIPNAGYFRASVPMFQQPVMKSLYGETTTEQDEAYARVVDFVDTLKKPLDETVGFTVEGDYREDRLENILWQLCQKTGLKGALLVDSQGLPLSIYNLAVGREGYAAMTAVLAEMLETTSHILKNADPRHLAIDLKEDTRLHLHRFMAGGITYHIVAVGSPLISPEGIFNEFSILFAREL